MGMTENDGTGKDKPLDHHVTAPYLHREDDVPIGHMCIEDKTPEPKIATTHESTNILLGMLCGHVENLVTESHRANRGADLRHDEWQETLARAGEIQVQAQKSGAKVVMIGICLMSTIISVVVSLLI